MGPYTACDDSLTLGLPRGREPPRKSGTPGRQKSLNMAGLYPFIPSTPSTESPHKDNKNIMVFRGFCRGEGVQGMGRIRDSGRVCPGGSIPTKN